MRSRRNMKQKGYDSMNTKCRIQIIRLLDLMHRNEEFCRDTRIYDVSIFRENKEGKYQIPGQGDVYGNNLRKGE